MEPNTLSPISGLNYVADYLSLTQHDSLLSAIDQAPWLNDLKRRVQHYGFKYDYKFRRIDLSMKIGELPAWALEIAKDLQEKQFFLELPDQLIVNEYLPGQGIASHIDCEPCFEGTIASISLGSACVMDFTHAIRKEKIPVLLEPCSLVVLQGDSRYFWTHGIAGRKADVFEGKAFLRQRRVSLTFRESVQKSVSKLIPTL